MPIQIRIPVQLRSLTKGAEIVAASGSSVQQLIEDMDRNYPGIKDRLCEGDGKLRRFVNIFVNEEDIRFLENLQTPITEKDEISIIPAIAGGVPRSKRSRQKKNTKRMGLVVALANPCFSQDSRFVRFGRFLETGFFGTVRSAKIPLASFPIVPQHAGLL